jgi:hypothetical protein
MAPHAFISIERLQCNTGGYHLVINSFLLSRAYPSRLLPRKARPVINGLKRYFMLKLYHCWDWILWGLSDTNIVLVMVMIGGMV